MFYVTPYIKTNKLTPEIVIPLNKQGSVDDSNDDNEVLHTSTLLEERRDNNGKSSVKNSSNNKDNYLDSESYQE